MSFPEEQFSQQQPYLLFYAKMHKQLVAVGFTQRYGYTRYGNFCVVHILNEVGLNNKAAVHPEKFFGRQ
jgi:hypothetical protein